MSNLIVNKVLDQGMPKEWPSGKRLVFLHLAERFNESLGKAYPGLEEMIRVSGLSKGKILDYIKQLKDEGFVASVSRGMPNRRAEYKVFFPSMKKNRVSPAEPLEGVESSLPPEEILQKLRLRLAEDKRASSHKDPKQRNI